MAETERRRQVLEWSKAGLKDNESLISILRWGGREKYFYFGFARNIKYQLADFSGMSDSFLPVTLFRLDESFFIVYIQ